MTLTRRITGNVASFSILNSPLYNFSYDAQELFDNLSEASLNNHSVLIIWIKSLDFYLNRRKYRAFDIYVDRVSDGSFVSSICLVILYKKKSWKYYGAKSCLPTLFIFQRRHRGTLFREASVSLLILKIAWTYSADYGEGWARPSRADLSIILGPVVPFHRKRRALFVGVRV